MSAIYRQLPKLPDDNLLPITTGSVYKLSKSPCRRSNISNAVENLDNILGRDFTVSDPYGRRTYDIFGDGGDAEDLLLLRSMLRTPYDIKRRLNEAAEIEKMTKAADESKMSKKQNKRVKKTKLQDESTDLKAGRSSSQSEANASKEAQIRVKRFSTETQFQHELQVDDHKVGRKKSLNTVTFADMIDAAIGESDGTDRRRIPGKEKKRPPMSTGRAALSYSDYFGVEAKHKFHELFLRSNDDMRVYTDYEDLPEDRKTPRSLYLREVARSNLNPLPLVLRNDGAPNEVSLAHRCEGPLCAL